MTATGGRVKRTKVIHGGKERLGLYDYYTKDGRHVFCARKKVEGRARWFTLKATTTTDAIREQCALVAKLDAGVHLVGRSDVSLRELRDEWEEWARSDASSFAASTVDLYLDRLDRHALRLLGGETKAAAVTPAHLRAMIDKLRVQGLSGSTVRCCVTATAAVLKLAVRRGTLEANPTRLLERGDRPSAKRKQQRRYLDRKQIDKLLAELGDEHRPIAAVCAFAGLRISEALALTWQDVDFDAAMLQVPGTKTASSAQPVPIIDALAAELRRHRGTHLPVPGQLVFQNRVGGPHHRKTVLQAVYEAGDDAGLNPPNVQKVGLHSLRHSCAGLLLAAGVPAPRVAAVLRHSDTRTLLTTYAGVVESQRSELKSDLEAAFS